MNKLILATIIAFSAFSIKADSQYISTVFEYTPAPGQFVNQIPEYAQGDTKETMAQKAAELICGDEGGLVTLGGFGGYIVFGFDHTITNIAGEYDFSVRGNCFGNSSEPGIIMVAKDTNKDGLPNDEWYEIAGSEYSNTQTIHNYEITYSRPASDKDNIIWTSNQNTNGYIPRNIFNTQPYYPQWINQDKITLNGTKLRDNAVLVAEIYQLKPFEWGYADNYPNTDTQSGIKIDWAVKADGTPANLDGIDFVKVYTALNQVCGNIGETSTEISGAVDLHYSGGAALNQTADKEITIMSASASSLIIKNSGNDATAGIYAINGSIIMQLEILSGISNIDISNLQSGIYILATTNNNLKFIKQ
ncbi:MAG: T9SS type A sorting domain-containing protein [Muribaculaceae bacterium]|nr:T9SS type A sorting domain-containing protein [Muribaculaceae bacterium]